MRRPDYTKEELEVLSSGINSDVLEYGSNKIDQKVLDSLRIKLFKDELFLEYQFVAFLPKLGKLLESRKVKVHDYGRHERGIVTGYDINGTTYVVKNFQTLREKEIIPIAIKTGIYPFYEMNERLLVEKSAGTHEEKLIRVEVLPEKTGEILADVYNRLHGEELIYGDGFYHHLFYHKRTGEIRLIDFGCANLESPKDEDLESAISFIKLKHPTKFQKGIKKLLDNYQFEYSENLLSFAGTHN